MIKALPMLRCVFESHPTAFGLLSTKCHELALTLFSVESLALPGPSKQSTEGNGCNLVSELVGFLVAVCTSCARSAGLTVRSAGLTVHSASLTVRSSGLTVRFAGLTVRFSGLTVRSSGLTARSAGLTVRSAGLAVVTRPSSP